MSLVVSALLLFGLVAAIALAVLDNPKSSYPPLAAASTGTLPPSVEPSPTEEQEPEAAVTDTALAAVEATATEPAATHTSTPQPAPTWTDSPTVAPGVQLGEQRRVEEAGFAFQPAPGYSLEFAGESVTISANDRGSAAGTLMLLQTEPSTTRIRGAASDLDSAFSTIVASMSSREMQQSGSPEAITVGGEAGQAVDFADTAEGADLSGRIAVARPQEDRLFLAVAFAPGAVWDETARADFDALLKSVEFFPPSAAAGAQVAQAAPPSIALDIAPAGTPEVESTQPSPAESATPEDSAAVAAASSAESPFGPDTEWRVASNGNFANQIAGNEGTLWTATDGGVVAWNKDSGDHVKFTTLDGLSANRAVAVESCALPGLGMLFATNSGLQVFDTQGGSWKTLTSASSPMSYEDLVALHCSEQDGYLVAAYARHGLDIFDAGTGEWTLVDDSDGLDYGIIRAIAVTPPQTVWIASHIGLTRYSDGESTLFNTDNSPMSDNVVTALASDGVDTVWLATAGDLYRTDGENWQTFNASTVEGGEYPNGSITGLAVAADGTVWVGSDQTQVCRFDPATGNCVEFFSNEDGMANAPLTSMGLDDEGVVYYTTAGAGVSAYDGEQWSLYYVEGEPVAGNRIRDMASIADGAVWVATSSGVSQVRLDDGLPLRVFTTADSPLLSQDVRVVKPIDADSAWFGTAGGANLVENDNWTSYTEADGLAGADVRALTVDGQSRDWIGSASGLSIWTGTGFFNLATENGLPSDVITTLLSDGDLVWIGTDAGLLRFQDNQLQVFNTGNISLPSDMITALALNADGSLLIGTDRGLARFHDNRIVAIRDVPSTTIASIATGGEGEAWVATNNGELYYSDGATWTLAPNLELLPSPLISSLLVDENGDLWIGTDEGGLAIARP